jgi:hypothetical protein
VASQNLDVTLGQTGTALLELGIWLRRTRGVPMLCVNTIHLASVYDVLLPDSLHASSRFKEFCSETVVPVRRGGVGSHLQRERRLDRAFRGLEAVLGRTRRARADLT